MLVKESWDGLLKPIITMNKTLIIAEAGVNHNGRIDMAHKLIDEAVKSGADIIKFQTFSPTDLSTENAELANYQKINLDNQSISQVQMLNDLKLNDDDYFQLIKHCNEKKIEFLTTAFDNKSLSLLKKFDLKRHKVASGEITNFPLLRKIAEINKPIILSTGMSSLGEVEMAIKEINRAGLTNDQIILLHCSSEYPVPYPSINLNAMKTLKKAFGVEVGYSDHSIGIEISIAAVALGGKVIEKHLTLDRSLPGPDHKASAEPKTFSRMVKSIRNIELALGNGIKTPSIQELENKRIVRKSIVAKKDINIGETFNIDNICVKRPGHGISPIHWEKLIGTTSKYDFKINDLIKW